MPSNNRTAQTWRNVITRKRTFPKLKPHKTAVVYCFHAAIAILLSNLTEKKKGKVPGNNNVYAEEIHAGNNCITDGLATK